MSNRFYKLLSRGTPAPCTIRVQIVSGNAASLNIHPPYLATDISLTRNAHLLRIPIYGGQMLDFRLFYALHVVVSDRVNLQKLIQVRF